MNQKTWLSVLPVNRLKRIFQVGIFPPDKTIIVWLALRRYRGKAILHILESDCPPIPLVEEVSEEFQTNLLAALNVPRARFNGASKFMQELVTMDDYDWVIYTLDGRVSMYYDRQLQPVEVSNSPYPLVKEFRRIQANSVQV